jgi:DNA replicative helicase MCM subunit Mcm2 (Cdc46/Mcm family)
MKRFPYRKIEPQYQTETKEIAKKARAIIIGKQQSSPTGFNTATELSSEQLTEEELNEQYPGEINLSTHTQTKSKQDHIFHAIEELEHPTESDIITFLSNTRLSEKSIEEQLNKTKQQGLIIRTNSGAYRIVS